MTEYVVRFDDDKTNHEYVADSLAALCNQIRGKKDVRRICVWNAVSGLPLIDTNGGDSYDLIQKETSDG